MNDILPHPHRRAMILYLRWVVFINLLIN
jgi:hypothetical protein